MIRLKKYYIPSFNFFKQIVITINSLDHYFWFISFFNILGDYPKLVHGCHNLEINLSTPVHYTVPIPQYLTALNETLNSSCMPILLTTTGLHEILCISNNDDFNISCFFNVSIWIENGFTPSLYPAKGNFFPSLSFQRDICVHWIAKKAGTGYQYRLFPHGSAHRFGRSQTFVDYQGSLWLPAKQTPNHYVHILPSHQSL